MSAWALGSVADTHAPIRTLEEAHADLRSQLQRWMQPRECKALLKQIAGLEAEIALRRKQENPHA